MELGKDITVTDMEEYDRTDINKFGIVVSSFSCRHNYRIARNLVKLIINSSKNDFLGKSSKKSKNSRKNLGKKASKNFGQKR